MTKECKSNCCNDPDCPCDKVCSESFCDKHFEQEKLEYAYLKNVPKVWVKP